MQINGVDISNTEHSKVVELLKSEARMVRLCVERRMEVPLDSNATGLDLTNSSSPEGKSPKLFGLPRPYTGLYSASSYMANRPSYMRNREPGQYTLDSNKKTSKSADWLKTCPADHQKQST